MTKLSNLLTSGGLRIIDTQTYSSNATWTKPAGAVWVRVLCWSGGAGGVSGGTPAATEGAGGACFIWEGPASSLSATVSVTVGAGGAPGSAGTPSPGGSSRFGTIIASPNTGAFGGLFSQQYSAATAANREATNGPGMSGSSGLGGIPYKIAGGGGQYGTVGGRSDHFSSAAQTSIGAVGANGNIAVGLGGAGGGGGIVSASAGGAGGVPGGGGGSSVFGGGAGGAGQVYVETWG